MKRIVCADALEWLEGQRNVGSIVTSLPDAEEIGATLLDWSAWYKRAVGLCLAAASPDCPVIFYQTDRKAQGQVVSKAQLCMNGAAKAGARLLWHKVVLRRGVGKVDLHRPGFTHLLAFSMRAKPGKATPDVLERGRMVYPNAMGLDVARFAVGYAGAFSRTIVDPFCGRGSVPAIADAMGFDAIGVDIDPEQCRHAEALSVSADEVSE